MYCYPEGLIFAEPNIGHRFRKKRVGHQPGNVPHPVLLRIIDVGGPMGHWNVSDPPNGHLKTCSSVCAALNVKLVCGVVAETGLERKRLISCSQQVKLVT